MRKVKELLRPHLLNLAPYSSARDEFSGIASVYLDANENAYGSITEKSYNRYPDPYQWILKEKIGQIKGVTKEHIFIGNGSDEPIDLLFRAFCEPASDGVIITPPTYGMYEVSANINNVKIKKISLTENFQLDVDKILAACDDSVKLLFICSPNNPTGNDLHLHDIIQVVNKFTGIVVLDEAYIDFSSRDSFLTKLSNFPNLVVLQTLSKAWGLASLRLGLAFASEEIIYYLNRIKPPYNISGLTQDTVLKALDNVKKKESMVKEILSQREELRKELQNLPVVQKIHPSDSNFLLVKTSNANNIYSYLVEEGIIVRNRASVKLCDNCLRITVGTKQENQLLIDKLSAYKEGK